MLLVIYVLVTSGLATLSPAQDIPDNGSGSFWTYRAHKSPTRLRHSRHSDRSPFYSSPYQSSPRDPGFDGSFNKKLEDANSNHKPVFKNCSELKPSVLEERELGSFVMKVVASDEDLPENGGKVTYSFVSTPGERLKFFIDPDTGVIVTKNIFDRDEPSREKEVYVTVQASDNGKPQLADVCTIKIVIEDINDNAPVFDKVSYQESVPQDLQQDREVMRISATDIDDGNNSIVTYDLEPLNPEDKGFFRIDPSTGVIYLNRTIDRNAGQKYILRATAVDGGDPPLQATINLDILVVESNKKSPSFTMIPSSPIILPENLTNYSYNIATLSAQSNTDEEAPVFELVQGRTEQTNKHSTFRLETEGSSAHIRLGRPMDYESISEYTLTIRIQNKYNLAAETSIGIQLQDVNDNIPIFTEVMNGIVLENEPPGTPVMQVRALDYDATTEHNLVTYELADNQENFKIDRYTGNITTLKIFDREELDFYNVKVIATDNSPSALFDTGAHNKGQQVFRIEIADKNDHAPNFTQKKYVAEAIPEDANINALVSEVKAVDNDTASPVKYSITDGNVGDAFIIEEATGKIRVKTNLDYENRTEYSLTVRAFDGAFQDYCTVEIKIENVNDNPPVFLKYENNIKIQEEEMVPGCVAQLEAWDPDIPDRDAPQHIVYFVVKQDQKKLLSINKKGCLSLIKPLDRDPPNGYETWQILIAASDEDGGPTNLRSTTEVVITLIDINDNAPYLDMVQPVVWKENQPPDGEITTLTAKDNDSPMNGPNFTFSISRETSDDIKRKFAVHGNKLIALVTFDREDIKSYNVPIQIVDSGIPPMTGTSMLQVIIGDENDNAMKEGHSNIFIYNYKGEAPDTEIGRVYVDDPDDWDLPDKTFLWAKLPNPHFDLNSKTGMITMLQGTSNQSFLLEFRVTEEGKLIARHTVDAYVNVTVKEIPEEAVDKSGSIRFSGITAEEFVQPNSRGESKQAKLKKLIATYLNVSEENVDVFTVLHSPHNTNPLLLDVRFSAHGSPYYSPEKLNAAVSYLSEQVLKELEVQIVMINIDECMEEKKFCQKDCTNFLNKSNVPSPVYTNTTTFVGVKAVVDPFCSCPHTPQTHCRNGGTPTEDGRCMCPEGHDGPRCETVSIGFDGDGWAHYQPFEACEEAHLSLEIQPNKPDGLVFYVGPTTRPGSSLYVQDFMSLEVRDGFPLLYVDFGSGTVKVSQNAIKLDDGRSHRIDVIWSKAAIELQVDNCKLPNCLSLTPPAGDNEFLNVNGPLQIGGSYVDFEYLNSHFNWTYKPTQVGFSGCVKNLTFNDKLYDLGTPGFWKHVDVGCNRGVSKAITFGIDTSFLIAILICLAILLVLLLAVVVHRRKTDDLYKDTDDIRETIINYEDEGGGEGDMNAYDLNVLRLFYEDPVQDKHQQERLKPRGNDEVPNISGFLDDKKQAVDNDPDSTPFDDVRHYAYEGGDGNSTGSLSSLASGTDDGDLNFDYLSNFGPRFRKLADMYGEDPSDDEDDTYQNTASESWC
ncbi:hypothetical protein GE061_018678 [Apolygus lucorum]|uniref:DE-cadherin n=1 Tax=Apolygus lucorum TaxID=248454 RepID=A0A8S9XIM1_APOLU|nr:hypothetical protein GE061_018678 [Apolygus lucorum]